MNKQTLDEIRKSPQRVVSKLVSQGHLRTTASGSQLAGAKSQSILAKVASATSILSKDPSEKDGLLNLLVARRIEKTPGKQGLRINATLAGERDLLVTTNNSPASVAQVASLQLLPRLAPSPQGGRGSSYSGSKVLERAQPTSAAAKQEQHLRLGRASSIVAHRVKGKANLHTKKDSA